MAKEKGKGKRLGVYKVEEKYHCAECHAEVPIKKPCSVCKTEIDWDRALTELMRR